MYLIELIAQKKLLDQKIEELQALLQVNPSEELATELMATIEKLQGKLIHIIRANNQSTLNLGGNEVTIAIAVLIRDTIKTKIDVLTTLITNAANDLDKINLQTQRDKYFNEYTLLNMGILRNDLNVQVG